MFQLHQRADVDRQIAAIRLSAEPPVLVFQGLSNFVEAEDRIEKEPRVLVVDDDPQVLTVVGKLLEAGGFHVELFETATQLLDAVAPDDVGCVVTDLEMPEVSGMEIQASLLATESSLSVIVITGHADVPRTIEIMGQGAITLLEKPFKADQLVREVERGIRVSVQHRHRVQRIEHAQSLISLLTEEELGIMQCVARGLPNKAISLELDLSSRTVDRRRHSAMEKLQITSVADFAILLATATEELVPRSR